MLESVGVLSAQGATISLDGSTITYDPTGAESIQSLAQGVSIDDTFQYTIVSDDGSMATATVTIRVTGVDDEPAMSSMVAMLMTTESNSEDPVPVMSTTPRRRETTPAT